MDLQAAFGTWLAANLLTRMPLRAVRNSKHAWPLSVPLTTGEGLHDLLLVQNGARCI